MNPLLDAYEPYKERILEGVRSERIVAPQGHFSGPFDKHGHLPGKGDDSLTVRPGALRVCNTRSMNETARTVLHFLFQNEKPRTFLELGAGAGKGCFDAWKLAEEMERTLTIDTVGLTPFSSHHGLEKTVLEIVRSLPSDILERTSGDVRELIKAALKDARDPSYLRLRLDAALALNELGERIFRVLSEPFVRKQHIGSFNKLKLDPEKYDLIYDQNGVSLNLIMEDADTTLRKTLALLNENGVFVCGDMSDRGELYDSQGEPVELGDFICIYGPESGEDSQYVAIFCHKDSELAFKLSPLLTSMTPANGIYLFEELSPVFQQMAV